MASGKMTPPYPVDTDAVNITGTSAKFEVYNADVVASRYLIRGKTCFLTLVLHCITPVSSSEAICSVPRIASCMGVSINFLMRNYYNPSQVLSGLIQNGTLYVIGGVASADYGVTIAYPID